MPIRLSGINSGLDTDAIVKELVSAYSLKTEKYEKQKTENLDGEINWDICLVISVMILPLFCPPVFY